MRPTVLVLTMTVLLAAGSQAFAQEEEPQPSAEDRGEGATPSIVVPPHILASLGPSHPARRLYTVEKPKRPLVLPVLYTSLIGLNAADLVTTRMVLDGGGVEVNPFMRPIVGRTPAIAVKAGASAAAIYFAEKMWPKKKTAAIIMMVIVNSVTASAVAHNTRVVSAQ